MNTPQQQSELYRKAAETIEMCAKHGIKPILKYKGDIEEVTSAYFNNASERYEFPISVIEGQLVWADTIVYNRKGVQVFGIDMIEDYEPYTLTPPKRTVMVELLIEDVERLEKEYSYGADSGNHYHVRVEKSCRKAIDNIKA